MDVCNENYSNHMVSMRKKKMAPATTNSSPTRNLKIIRPRSLSLHLYSSARNDSNNDQPIHVIELPQDNPHEIPQTAPILNSISECENIERRIGGHEFTRLNKQSLRKTPSNSIGSTKNQSPRIVASVSSPTSKSRITLQPTSPGPGPPTAGHRKQEFDDFNPFGADLVRYQNGFTLITANRTQLNGRNSEMSNLFTMTEKDDMALLGKTSIARIDSKLDSTAGDVEKSGMDAWPETNGNGNGGGGFLRNRFSTRRIRNRLMQKDGECNISLHNVPKQKSKYFADIFTTLVEVKWRWCLLIFAMGFLLSWLLFAVVYYLIMLSHGDFDHDPKSEPNWQFCIHNINNFVSVFMFSLETQHTIGYGSRFPSEECPAVVATVCLQSMVGVMIQTFMAGIVFAKLARAKKRAQTLIFSKNAVVCMRDGKLCFLFRVGDMRKSQLAEAHVRLQMISKRITNEGELLPFHQFDMNVGYDCGLDRIFVVWPITVCHVIDENSPLYEYSADDLATARFEIIAILEGVVPSTGTTTQARTSYLPQEIIWGSRFEKLVTYQRENGEYRIDFSKFHKIYPQETPTCSARDLDLLREAGLNMEDVYHVEGEDQAENQGLTPYSTVESRSELRRPSILPPKDERSNSIVDAQSIDGCTDFLQPMEEDEEEETGHLLPPPPPASVLITMSPAERKASIAAAALAFRKNKSLSESARKPSLIPCSRFRKPSIYVAKVGSELQEKSTAATSTMAPPQCRTPTPSVRILRHAASTGSVAVPTLTVPHGCNMKPRPSSVLREHDIM